VTAKKRNGARAKVAEAAAEYRTQALGEVFWLAFQQLSKGDQGVFLRRLLEDPGWFEDIFDSIMIIQSRNEPTRPFEEFEEDLRREGLA
jgi:hypothetical protein